MENNRPVALYNTEKQELFAVFSTQTLAGKYIFPCEINNKAEIICASMKRKLKIGRTIFSFKVAARHASKEQIELMAGNKFYIKDGYEIPKSNLMKGCTILSETTLTQHRTNKKTLEKDKPYRLFLDDKRMPLDVYKCTTPALRREYKGHAWTTAKTYNEFVYFIENYGVPTHISFDHDLHECAKWLCDYLVENNLPMPVYYIHSQNPVGADNIRSVLNCFERKFNK